MQATALAQMPRLLTTPLQAAVDDLVLLREDEDELVEVVVVIVVIRVKLVVVVVGATGNTS